MCVNEHRKLKETKRTRLIIGEQFSSAFPVDQFLKSN